jgi:hypothetical protein
VCRDSQTGRERCRASFSRERSVTVHVCASALPGSRVLNTRSQSQDRIS